MMSIIAKPCGIKKLVSFCISVGVLFTTSCATSDQSAESRQAAQAAITPPAAWATEVAKNAGKQGNEPAKWLQSFNDPTLLKLIAEAKANNFDLKAAAGRMNKAQLLAKQSGVALKPTVDLSLGANEAGRLNSSSSNTQVSIGLKASWELDLWGRLQAGVNAAQASAQAAKADYVFAQHSLSANISNAYLKTIAVKLQKALSQKNLSILQETMRITQLQYDNGTSSAQNIAVNKANLAVVKERLITLEGSERDALRSLEVLLGRYPSASADIPDVLPTLPSPPPAGIPAEILERRPDIVSAERQIAGAFNATAQAKAARLPRLSLTASIGGASNSLSDVLDPANVAWKLGSNLLAPLFDGGKRKIDVEIATVEQKQAINNYAQKALNAFSEVESNLDQGTVLANREVELQEAFKQSGKAYTIAKLRYREGEIDLLDTLQIQQQAISAESNLLTIKETQLEQRINLYMALGGSW